MVTLKKKVLFTEGLSGSANSLKHVNAESYICYLKEIQMIVK